MKSVKMNLSDSFQFQFIDGRLAKLNAGKGFCDVFEEEVTAGGFCGGKDDFLGDCPSPDSSHLDSCTCVSEKLLH